MTRLSQMVAVDPEYLQQSNIAEWPRLWDAAKKRNFILESWRAVPKARDTWIKAHGVFLTQISDDHKALGPTYICTAGGCVGRFFEVASGTSGAAKHIQTTHGLYDPKSKSARRPPTTPSARSTSSRESSSLLELFGRTVVAKSAADKFKEVILDWIVDGNVPFSVVEHPSFRELLSHLNSDLVEECLPESYQTIARWIKQRYEAELTVKKEEMLAVAGRVHLSFDGWTSPTAVALVGVIAHYVTVDGSIDHTLLGLPRIQHHHTGENNAAVVMRLLSEWGLTFDQVGYIVTDNASTNDAAVKVLLKTANPNATDAEISDMTKIRRLRCFCHALNLVAKTLLGTGGSAMYDEQTLAGSNLADRLDGDEDLETWRKAGAVGKVQYLVRFVRSSTVRMELFRDTAMGVGLTELESNFFHGEMEPDEATAHLSLKLDNATRWNSIYFMIERALLLQGAIRIFYVRTDATARVAENRNTHIPPIFDKKISFPPAMHLSNNDWADLADLTAVLQLFKMRTKLFERRTCTSFEVMPSALGLRDTLEAKFDEYQENPSVASTQFTGTSWRALPPMNEISNLSQAREAPITPMQRGLTLAIQHLDDYIRRYEATPAYWSATILHPLFRTTWVLRRFRTNPTRATRVVSAFKELYARDYQNHDLGGEATAEPPPQRQLSSRIQAYGMDHLEAQPQTSGRAVDEVEVYTTERINVTEIVDDEEPLLWWRANRTRFPRLYRMACELLSIPGSSAECERTFSTARLTLGLQRGGMTEDTINRIECCKQWRKARVKKVVSMAGGTAAE